MFLDALNLELDFIHLEDEIFFRQELKYGAEIHQALPPQFYLLAKISIGKMSTQKIR